MGKLVSESAGEWVSELSQLVRLVGDKASE